MAQFEPSSFIPKDPLTAGVPAGKNRPKRLNILMLIATAVFVLSALLAGGAFVYKKYVFDRIAKKQEEIRQVKNDMQIEVIEEIIDFNTRLKVGEELLSNHVAITPKLALIGELTLKDVQFTSFEFAKANDRNVQVTLGGTSDSYEAIALQADSLASSRFIRNPIVSGLEINDEGNVRFTATVNVDPAILLYRNMLQTQ